MTTKLPSFFLLLLVVLGTVVLLWRFNGAPVPERWPTFSLPSGTAERLALREKERQDTPVSYVGYIKDHEAFGDYLNMGMGICVPGERAAYDDRGILQQEYRGTFHYHPVLAAQCGLKAWGRYLRHTDPDYSEAVKYADNMLELQDSKGGFEYPFAFGYYLTGKDLSAGWTSGMAQGQGMSLLARVLTATDDPKYLSAGKKALSDLITPVENGGLMTTLAAIHPSLSNYIFFEEYVSNPPNYTLNGYMFALLGLYDWSQLPSKYDADQDVAKEFFERGMETLVKTLHYYDMGSLTSYDLGYITFKADPPNISNSYHGVHLYLLNALYSVTKEPILLEYYNKWEGYLDAPN